jgi:hypothetical protein
MRCWIVAPCAELLSLRSSPRAASFVFGSLLFTVLLCVTKQAEGADRFRDPPSKMIVHPAPAIDVLRNLKSAIDDGLLLQEGFYSMPNLEEVLAAQKARWLSTARRASVQDVQV